MEKLPNTTKIPTGSSGKLLHPCEKSFRTPMSPNAAPRTHVPFHFSFLTSFWCNSSISSNFEVVWFGLQNPNNLSAEHHLLASNLHWLTKRNRKLQLSLCRALGPNHLFLVTRSTLHKSTFLPCHVTLRTVLRNFVSRAAVAVRKKACAWCIAVAFRNFIRDFRQIIIRDFRQRTLRIR